MTPDEAGSALAFLLFVAPGIFFDLLSRSRRVGAEESAFREVSRVALSSLPLSLLAAAAVGFVASRFPIVVHAVRAAEDGDLVWVSGEGAALLGAALTHLAVSCALAYALHRVLRRLGHGQNIVPESQWTRVFRRDCPPGHDIHVRAKMTSGAVWIGRLLGFSPDFEVDHRELVLGRPMQMRGPHREKDSLVDVPPDYQRVILRGVEIAALAVQYELADRPTDSSETRLTAWTRWWRARPRGSKQPQTVPRNSGPARVPGNVPVLGLTIARDDARTPGDILGDRP